MDYIWGNIWGFDRPIGVEANQHYCGGELCFTRTTPGNPCSIYPICQEFAVCYIYVEYRLKHKNIKYKIDVVAILPLDTSRPQWASMIIRGKAHKEHTRTHSHSQPLLLNLNVSEYRCLSEQYPFVRK
jgi:hypothetical protein